MIEHQFVQHSSSAPIAKKKSSVHGSMPEFLKACLDLRHDRGRLIALCTLNFGSVEKD
jgi:hypothetical protein